MATSSTSSSSSRSGSVVDGLMDITSYRLISKSYPMERDYEGEIVYCFCNLKSPRWCSWTESNPGRRFYGCHHYPASSRCKFYCWHDEKSLKRVVDVINELQRREKLLFQQANVWNNHCASTVETSLRCESERLRCENQTLRVDLEWMSIKLRRSCPSEWTCSSPYVFWVALMDGFGVLGGVMFMGS